MTNIGRKVVTRHTTNQHIEHEHAYVHKGRGRAVVFALYSRFFDDYFLGRRRWLFWIPIQIRIRK